MNIVSSTHFGPVEGIRLGYGPLGKPLMDVIVYRLGDTLVDTGQSHMLRPLLNILASRPPRRILLTHYHEDHSGNAGALVARFHAKLMAPEGTMARVAAGFRIRPYQHYIWGRAKSAKSEALPPLVETNGFRLRPIHTPGHSRDHTAYLEESNGWLFSGDVYLGDRIKFFRADEEFGPQIASLKKLLTLDFDTLFCAHNPALDNGKKRLAAKLAFLEDFYGQVSALRAKGMGEKAIVAALDPGLDRLVRFITLGNVSFANMVRAALGDMPS